MLPEFKGVHYEEALQKLKLNILEKEGTGLTSFVYTRCTKA